MPTKAIMKPLDGYIRETTMNYTKGFFMKIRAINASFDSIMYGKALVVLERKLWGEWRRRWRMELVDTVQLSIGELINGGSIQAFSVLGFGYVLTDFRSIQDQTLRRSRTPDLAAIRRKWEKEHLKTGFMKRYESDVSDLARPDSVDDNLPCCPITHVITGSLYENTERAKKGKYTIYPQPELVVFSDRFGTNSYVKPDSRSENLRELKFLEPYYVVDTCGEFFHIVEYKYGATVRSNGRIKSCLQDFGWVKKSKVMIGSNCLKEEGTNMPLVFAGTERPAQLRRGPAQTVYRRRYYQNPSLSDEREDAPIEGSRLYVYSINGTSVLVGNRPDFDAHEATRVIVGWVRTKDLLKGLQDE
jgi:hypothetical protein